MNTIQELREYVVKTSDFQLPEGDHFTTFGCDPELFVRDTNTGKLRSSIGLINAGKKDPKQMLGMPTGYMIQEDNVALEYNTPPASSASFGAKVTVARRWIKNHILIPNELEVVPNASEIFPEEELQHPKAQEFGCDPDFNVYEQQDNPRPNARNKALRSAGGHIHIGAAKSNWRVVPDHIKHEYGTMLAKLLDVRIGCALAEFDDDKRRMKLYGTPGSIRFKPYGIEYRTPSNFWSFLEARDINYISGVIASCDDWLSSYLFSNLGRDTSKFVESRVNYALELAPITRAAIKTGDKTLIKEINADYGKRCGDPFIQHIRGGIAGLPKKQRTEFMVANF